MKKVLVTGASGFIGRHTLIDLLSKYDEVHGVNNDRSLSEYKNVHWHQVDLLDGTIRGKLIKNIRPTHLLHLAWYAEPGKYAQSLLNIDWLKASIDLIKEFTEAGGERVVCAGTCFEYDFSYGFCSEFDTPKNPETIYGVCKNSLQEILRHYSEKSGLSSSWGRIFYLYGPYEYPGRLVSSVIISLLKGETAPCSEGNQKKDFLHVEDVARAFVSLLESSIQGPVNIGSGNPISVKDLVLQIGEIIGRGNLIRLGARPTPESEPPMILADDRRLRLELGWSPKYKIDSGLKNTISWWKDNIKVIIPLKVNI